MERNHVVWWVVTNAVECGSAKALGESRSNILEQWRGGQCDWRGVSKRTVIGNGIRQNNRGNCMQRWGTIFFFNRGKVEVIGEFWVEEQHDFK